MLTHLGVIGHRDLPVSYSVKNGYVEVRCIGGSQEGLSPVASFGQREGEDFLELVDWLATGSEVMFTGGSPRGFHF